MEELIKQILVVLGENIEREGLVDTPKRVAKAYKYMTKGYTMQDEDVINGAIFNTTNNNMVIVKDIEFYSLCEHHMLPFFGKVHMAYIPNGKIIGLSKICRLVDMYSRRLQVQENLAEDIAQSLQRNLEPRGIGVIIEATHLCMSMRGVRKQKSKTNTFYFSGLFENNIELQLSFQNQLSKI